MIVLASWLQNGTIVVALQAIGIVGDVRKQDDVVKVLESTIRHFGKLDILVNAAAGNFLVSAEDLSPNGFRTGCYLYHQECIFFLF